MLNLTFFFCFFEDITSIYCTISAIFATTVFCKCPYILRHVVDMYISYYYMAHYCVICMYSGSYSVTILAQGSFDMLWAEDGPLPSSYPNLQDWQYSCPKPSNKETENAHGRGDT